MVDSSIKCKITTIKLSKSTKDRIDKLRVYKRETYDEILQNVLTILNICKVNPEAAKRRLSLIDKRGRKSVREARINSPNLPVRQFNQSSQSGQSLRQPIPQRTINQINPQIRVQQKPFQNRPIQRPFQRRL